MTASKSLLPKLKEVCLNKNEFVIISSFLEKFRLERIDGLIHNAGAMDDSKHVKASVSFEL